jgi:uncharacterized protein (TIGR02246 family)
LSEKRWFLGIVLAIAASGAAMAAEVAAVVSPTRTASVDVDSDQAVRDTLAAMNAVLAQRDSAGFMALFEDNDDIVLVGSDKGEVFKGRAAVGGFLQMLYGLPFVFSFDMPDVTVHREKHQAWLFADGEMVHTRADGSSTRRPYRITLVMKMQDHAWRWQLFSGSVPGAERPGPGQLATDLTT